MHSILLNPGPVTLSTRVRAALQKPDICHREPEFATLLNQIRRDLLGVYQNSDDYTSIILTGSGTAAVEAMVGTLVPKNGVALVVANGVYGERMADMLAAQGKRAYLARAEWVESINLARAEELLANESDITHVLAVHLETTTGRLNDIGALGRLCSRYQKPLLLDSVSSFGAAEINFTEWNIAACAATANKCLHGVPGIAFVIARKSALTDYQSGATSLYLDLQRYYQEQERGGTPFTQSVHCCYALAEALSELFQQGGWPARQARYQVLTNRVLQALQEEKIVPLLEVAPSSAALMAYKIPDGFSYSALHDFLKAAGFIIYAGQGKFNGEIFRIAVMGEITDQDIERLISAFQQFWQRTEKR